MTSMHGTHDMHAVLTLVLQHASIQRAARLEHHIQWRTLSACVQLMDTLCGWSSTPVHGLTCQVLSPAILEAPVRLGCLAQCGCQVDLDVVSLHLATRAYAGMACNSDTQANK